MSIIGKIKVFLLVNKKLRIDEFINQYKKTLRGITFILNAKCIGLIKKPAFMKEIFG